MPTPIIMTRTPLAATLALLLAACSPSSQETPAVSATPAPAAAAPVAAEPAPAVPADDTQAALDAVLNGSWRTPAFVARDVWRHPRETLTFFGVTPQMTVVEITPGGGWYAELLAPYLRDRGSYVGAIVDATKPANAGARDYYAKSNQALRDKLAADAERYGRAVLLEYDPASPVFGAPASADAVLTFRNVHNWMTDGSVQGMFRGFFDVLKPGGVLGVSEHRAATDVPEGDRSGYVSEAQVIAYATAAGFVLEEKSEVNANPKDTRDHPNGVWTLPPSNRHEDVDRAKYEAIGESDRMTLRFRKPAA